MCTRTVQLSTTKKNILANQLVSPADVKEFPGSVSILYQFKIGEGIVSHKRSKRSIPKTSNAKSKRK